ncbi:MAG: PorV/PorQ family protein [Endomicrobiales bacterium]
MKHARASFYVLLMLLCPPPLQAWFSVPGTGKPAEYLSDFSGGARGLALGFAQTALAGQAQLLYANPAGIASLWWREASFSMTPLFAGGNYYDVSFGYPVDEKYALGLGLVQLLSGAAERTSDLGEVTGTFSDRETALVLSYGRRFTAGLDGGAAVKFLSQDMDTLSEKAVSADCGLIWRPSPAHTWGATLMNLVPASLGPDRLPLLLRLGFRHAFMSKKLFWSADADPLDAFTGARSVRWATGLEYRRPEWLFCRFGLNQKQVSAGFGITSRQFDLDYAAAWHPLGFLHTVTMSFRYGFMASEAQRQVEKEWDALRSEKESFFREKRSEDERVRREAEKLRKDAAASVKFEKARWAFEEKKYEEALQALEEVLTEAPGHEQARALRAEIVSRRDRAVLLKRLNEGRGYYQQGKYEQALQEAAFLLDVEPSDPDARVLKHLADAQLAVRGKKFGEAKSQLMEILKLDPNDEEANRLLKRLQTVLEMTGEQ